MFKYSKVMVVDDNDIDLLIADRIIKKYHFGEEVIKMESAEDALTYLGTIQKAENLPAVIFLDINMPGMNGFDFLDEYEKLPADIRNAAIIVMLTSSLNPDDHMRAVTNPHVQKFVNKPLTQEKIQSLFELAV